MKPDILSLELIVNDDSENSRQTSNENKNPIVLALLIGQEAVISL